MTDLVSQMRVTLEEAFRRGLAAVDPRLAVKAELQTRQIEGPITLVAIGKAAAAMAQGAIEVLENQVVGGVVVAPTIADRFPSPKLRYLEGGHPIPSAASLQAGRVVMATAAGATGTLLVLISGGASALVEAPREGLTLPDLVTTYRLLLRAGLPIERINVVRRHLSALKNGGLLAASPATTMTLLIADVVGTDASAIGSGPTMADSSTPADAIAIATEAGILEMLPAAVVDTLRTPTSPRRSATGHSWSVVADGTAALRAAADYTGECGFNVHIDPESLSGDAAEEGRRMAAAALPSIVTLRHGETVVRVRGESPGGRNQHAALAAALVFDGQSAVFAALATDGRDGLTESAGAVVDGRTCHRLRAAAIDPEEMLAECRAHEALAASGDLVTTGPTGTNVADIWMSWRQD